LVVLLVLVGAVIIAGRVYLSSSRFQQQVVSRLQETYGGPVAVQSADIGMLGNTELHGLRLYEPGKEGEDPWATFQTVTMDVSALDLLRGEMPRHMTINDPSVELRFDRDGHLLTQLPQQATGAKLASLPTIHIDGGQVIVRQVGRPEMMVKGITARAEPESGRLSLSGTVKDDYWGDWSLRDAEVDPATGVVKATLSADHAEVTQDKLLRLPIVPAAVWREVEAQGTTPVTFTFRHDPTAKPGEQNHYRVELDPESANITLPTLALSTQQVRGHINVEDSLVTLDKVSGRALGGGLSANGTLDFRGKDDVFDLFVKATGLDVPKVPEAWEFPEALRKFGGSLTGQAQVKVRIADGKVTTAGSTGQGKITGMQVAGGTGEIDLRLEASPRGFRFSPPADQRRPASTGRHPAIVDRLLLTTLLLQAPAKQEPTSPVGVGGAVERGLNATGGAIIDAGTRALRLLPRGDITKPAPANTPPTYLDINLNLKYVDLARFVKELQLKVPFDVAGRLNLKVQASLPVDRPRDLKAYKVTGTATLPTFTLSGLDMKDVTARVRYDDGVLRLDDFRGQLAGSPPGAGTFTGTARLGIEPPGDLTANVKLADIGLTPLLRAGGVKVDVAGTVSGSAELRAPSDRLRDLSAWHVTGSLNSKRIDAYGWSLTNVGAALRADKGLLTVRDVTGKLEGAPVTGSGEAKLTEPYTYSAKVELANGDLVSLQRLAPEFRPSLAVAGRFGITAEINGTLSPLTTNFLGTGTGDDVKIENVRIDSLRFHWARPDEVLKLTNIKAKLYGGEATGTADVPLDARHDGKLDLRFEDVDVGGLAKDVPAVPLRVEGKASGSVKGTLAMTREGRSFDGNVDLSSPRLLVQNLPTEKLTGALRYQRGVGEYHLKGGLLGGTFELDGRIPPRPATAPPPKPESPPDSQLRIRGAQLGRLGRSLYGAPGQLDDLHGRVDLDVDFRLEGPSFTPVGSGGFSISRLRWGDRDIAGSIRGDVVLAEGQLRLRNLSGSVGGGTLRGQVALGLRDPSRSFFNIALDSADAARVLAPWPALAANVSGSIDGRLRGTLGRVWNGGGHVVLTRGRVFGLEVAELRMPVRFEVAPTRGRAEVGIEDIAATVGRGRINGRATLGFGIGTHMDGNLRFSGVDLQALRLTQSNQLVGGQVSGRMTFSGNDVRSLDDVTATVEASLSQTQAFQLPVLSQTAPFLGPGRSSTTFQSGDLRGRLAGGVFRVQRLSLSGNTTSVFAEGTVTTSGRLNLSMTATTRLLGPGTGLLQALGLRLPLIGPVPLALLVEATGYLSSASIHLVVTGTVRSPSVRVEPLSLLTDEAARFFLLPVGRPQP
jgi:hypothetical protein